MQTDVKKTEFGTILELDSALNMVKGIILEELKSDSESCNLLTGHYNQSAGKMIRPKLVLLCGGACRNINEMHIISAAVFQMIHDATLLHDDVIDDGHTRRGMHTINHLWGSKAAILLGDVFLSHAFKLSVILPPKAIGLIAETITRTCEGEISQDISLSDELREEEYLQIIKMKSAVMFGNCCFIGAFLSGEEESVCEDLRKYGILNGIAYQISDDLADLFISDEQLGKNGWKDISNQTITLPIIHLVSNGYDLAEIETMERTELLKLLEDNGSVYYCRELINDYCTQAIDLLGCIEDNDHKTALRIMTEAIQAKSNQLPAH